MKKLTSLLIALTSLLSGTSALACLGEAQLIAQVARTEKTMASCRVYIEGVRYYQINQICPLDLSEVINQGIEVGLSSGLDCAFKEGSDISGIVVKSPQNFIFLE